MTAATVASAGVSKNEQLAGTSIAGRTFRMPPMGDGMSGKGGGIVGNADHQSSAIFQNIINSIGDGDPHGIGAAVVIIDAKRADSQQRPGFLKGRQVRCLLSSAIPPNHSLLNRSTSQSGVERNEAASGVGGRPALFGPFRKLSRTAGVRSSNTCRRSDVSIDMVRDQGKCGLANFGSKGEHQR